MKLRTKRNDTLTPGLATFTTATKRERNKRKSHSPSFKETALKSSRTRSRSSKVNVDASGKQKEKSASKRSAPQDCDYSIDPGSLPSPCPDSPFLGKGISRAKSKKCRKLRITDSRTDVRDMYCGDSLLRRVDWEQLARIYVTLRRESDRILSTVVFAPYHQKERRQACVAAILDNLVQAITVQPTVQDLRHRIRCLKVRGRPNLTDEDIDPTALGYELKLRLAAVSPLLHSTTDGSTGRLRITRLVCNKREVNIYDVTEDDDMHLQCSMSVDCRTPSAYNKCRVKNNAQNDKNNHNNNDDGSVSINNSSDRNIMAVSVDIKNNKKNICQLM